MLVSGISIVVVVCYYFIESTNTKMSSSASKTYRTTYESTNAYHLFPLLNELTVSGFILDVFPMAESREQENFRGYSRFVVFDRQNDPIGFVYEVQEDLRCPVCNNVRLLVALDAVSEIKEIQVLEPLELSGEPLPVEDETRFFAQFTLDRNEAFNEPSYVLGENVDGITGATKSSIHIVDALNRLLFTHRG